MKVLKVIFSLAVFLGLSGCASIMNGTHEKLSVMTVPAEHASCIASNNKGKWIIADTPAVVTVHKSSKPLDISCHKPGYKPADLKVRSEMQGAIAGNVLFGGVIGAGIDAANGSAYSYPHNIIVPMKKRV